MSIERLSAEQWKAMYTPDRKRFLVANNLLDLPADEQEAEWKKYLEGLEWFFSKLSKIDTIIMKGRLMDKASVLINPLDEHVAIFKLSSGERIDVALSEDGVGLTITSWRRGIMVRPRDGSSVEIRSVREEGGL